ncbi:MAG TPA: hypothetical protein DCS93_14480 [Microscillaceae bacterium]|nr:hypothetical protein [Microscillaceae bacterium]
MREVYRSPYQTFILFASEALLVEVWNETSDDLTDEIYKQEYLKVVEALFPIADQYDQLLIDARNFQYPVSPTLQQWHSEHILSKFNQKTETRIAIVKSESPLAQYALEQTLEENDLTEEKEKIKLFDQMNEASQWLIGKTLDCRTTPAQIICYQQRTETLTQVWNAQSENIESATLTNEFHDFAALVKAYQPFKLLLNALNLNFPILPETQTWFNQQIKPQLLGNVKYIALVISKNAHAQLSIDQMLEEIKAHNLTIESFETYQEASQWLNP